MNTLSIPVVAMASISFYVGFYHLLIHFRRRQNYVDLAFAFLCFAIVFYDAFCVGLYNATSVSEGVQWQKAQFISLAVFVPVFLWFVSGYIHQKPGPAIYCFWIYYLFTIIVQLADRSELTFLMDQPSIKHIILPYVQPITYYEAALGPFTTIQGLMGMVTSTYILIVGIRYFRRGYQQKALPLIVAIGLMYAAGLHDTLVSNGVYHFIYLIEYAYLAVILLMAYSLSNTVVEAAIAKDELRKSEEWFRSLIETTSDWVWEVDAEGKYTYASPKVRELLGYETKEVLGHTPFDFMPPDESQSVGRVFQSIIQNQGVFERVENINLRKDGQFVVLETSGIPYFNEEGALLGYRGIDRDITERKKAENALKESEEKFRSIVENSLTGIFKIDNTYHFVYANNEFCRILGYPRDQLLGLDFRMVLSEDSRDVIADRYARRQRGENVPSRYELEVVRLDGEVRHTEMIVNVVNDASGRPSTMGQLVDITERKQAEVALKQSQQMLRTVLDQFPGVVYWKNRQSVYLGCNQASATAAGLANPAEIVGKTDFDLPWAATEAMAYRADDKAVMESKQPRLGVIEPQHRADGSLAWLDTAKVPLMDELGNVIGVLGTSRDITEQVHTLHALQETEFFLNRSQQVARIGSYKFDVQSGSWESSPSLDEIFGIDDAFSKNMDGWLSLVIPEDRETMRDHILRHVLTEQQRFEKEYRIIRPNDGQLRWMFGLGELEFDNTGRPIRMIGTIQDITERRQSEEALRESEAKFRLFVEQSSDGFVLTDEHGTVIEWNQANEHLTGLSRQEAVGLPLWEISDLLPVSEQVLELKPFLKQQILLALQTGQADILDSSLEVAFFRRDGTKSICQQMVFGIKTNQGYRIGQISHDITERKQAEEELRASEGKYRQLVEVSPIPMWINKDGVITYINPAALQVLGATNPEQVVGRDVLDFIHPEYHAVVEERVSQMIVGEKIAPLMEEKFLRLDGSILDVEVIATQFITSGGLVNQVLFQDISKRKQNEAERETLIANLEAQNAELERFTYTVSHDLKAPLITIRGFLGYIEQDARTGEMEHLKADLQRITAATDKMQRLLNELLELSRIGRLMNPPVNVSLLYLVQEAIKLLEGRLQERNVEIKIQDDLPIVFGDSHRLLEVIQNLLDNAVKFMGTQPKPVIEVGTEGEENGKPILYVRDNGIGIAPEYHDRIFGLFNKLNPHAEGTGVGLAIVKRIVEVHKGRIWVKSEEGKGTTFYFTLEKGNECP